MREPDFWWRRNSVWARLLSPLGAIYGVISAWRMAQDGIDAQVPVICVGNYHVGGAGKTPTAMALVKLLRGMGETPVVLTRGYGGRLTGPVVVEPSRHDAREVGDEPLLIARHAPVIVAKDRAAGARAARERGASVIVMDDGFQNPAVKKDLSLIVVDGARGLGNGCVFPAGPLRASLRPQIARTNALIVVSDGHAADNLAGEVRAKGGDVLRAALIPDAAAVEALRGKPLLAFAGIGDPERFFAGLRNAGLDVAATRVFADHHAFTSDEIAGLIADARRVGQTPVTTEKDFVRVRGLGIDEASIHTFPVAMTFSNERALADLLRGALTRARARRSG